MVWEKRMRRFAWVLFFVMWVPLAAVIWSAVTDTEEPPVEALVLFFGLMVLFVILLIGSFGIGSLEKDRIKRSGIPAKATILSVTETGTTINDKPLVRIELEVQPPYDSRFVATVEYILPYPVLQELHAGKKISVFYLEETKEVALADL